MSQTPKVEFCVGCDHPIGRHYTDPLSVIRCCQVAVNDGLWGSSLSECDCADYVSESANRRRQKKADATAATKKRMQEIVAEVHRPAPAQEPEK